MSLTVRLFGPVSVELYGRPLSGLRTRKEQWLLGLLALRQGRPVDRRWLAATLWPDSAESQALHNLRRSLCDLRKSLGGGDQILVATPGSLCLAREGAQVDVVEFDAAIARGDRVSLQEAVSRYVGTLLEDCSEEWTESERRPREQAYLRALETLALNALTGKDPRAAIGFLRAAQAVEPLREETQRHLMRALALVGERAALTESYRAFRLLLHRELNSAPGAETSALYEVLRAAPVAITTPSLPPSRPPPALPNVTTNLVGRRNEVIQVAAFLKRARLVTITGMGGVGKTRLALATAEELGDLFSGRVVWADFAPVSEEHLVLQVVATALGVRENRSQELLDTLAYRLKPSPVLLVLDNCEHLVDACADLVLTLLGHAPDLRILSTSRQPLNVPGEQVYRLGCLSLPPRALRGKRGGPDPHGYEATTLFLDRAGRVRSDFTLTREGFSDLVEIVYQLDGLPLAIELAAAWVRSLSLREISLRLAGGLRLLSCESRHAAPRQQTLHAALDWSFALLDDQERRLFRRLSVFAGGWRLESAEKICADIDLPAGVMLDVLARLVDKSLVVAEWSGADTRYRLLKTVQQFGDEKLDESSERERFQRRHCETMSALVEEVLPALELDQGLASEHLEAEHNEFRNALLFCLGDPDGTESGLRLAGALSEFWFLRGHLSEGRQWLAKALGRTGSSSAAKARALNGAGRIAGLQGDYTAAAAYFQEMLSITRELKHSTLLAAALVGLGFVLFRQGLLDHARELLEESLTIEHDVRHLGSRGFTLNCLGLLARTQGDYLLARRFLEESTQIARGIGNVVGLSNVVANLGTLELCEGRYEQARDLYLESLAAAMQSRNCRFIADSLEGLAAVLAQQGQSEAALQMFGAAEAIGAIEAAPMQPYNQAITQANLALARSALSPSRIDAAWTCGQSMSPEAALQFAHDTRALTR